MKVLGIDPGLNGGWALLDENGTLETFSFSNKSEKEISNSLSLVRPDYAFIEQVHAAPGQGVSSMFTFGRAYGFVRGVLASRCIDFDSITPQAWQRLLRIPNRNGKTYSEHKRLLKDLASKLYPNHKITLANADAILIAHAGMTLKIGKLDI